MTFLKAALFGEISKTVRGGQAQSSAKAACPPHTPPVGHARCGVGECVGYSDEEMQKTPLCGVFLFPQKPFVENYKEY